MKHRFSRAPFHRPLTLDFTKNESEVCRQGQQSKHEHVMQSETPSGSESESLPLEARQLCTSCAAPNEPSADFCVKCGAPISWYSKIGPFESIFAQGFILREAAGRPRRLIVVLGIWLIFLPQVFAGPAMIHDGFIGPFFGGGMSLVAIAIILKTTWNYFSEKPNKPAADQTDSETDARAV